MEKEKLDMWIEKLNAEPDGKKRNALMGGMCKENGLKIDEAWKLLKEAGFDPKAVRQDEGGGDKPLADGGGEPPADGGDEPPADGGEEPPADGGGEPPADGGGKPPAVGGGEPPAVGGGKPPAVGGGKPPAVGGGEPPAVGGKEPESRKTSVTARHKTEYPYYRRAGIVLSRKAAAYEVTAEQLDALKKDRWVEILEAGKK
jgi:hypothetical protein